jgi:hypothetical protein
MSIAASRVCARCGEGADERAFCATCGLNLAAQTELPTRAQWEAANAERPSAPALRSRDRLLGYAGWIAAGCLAFDVVGTFLGVVSDLTHHQIAGVDVSDGFAFLANPLAVLAAGFVGAAYLGPRENRLRRLFSGAVVYGLSNGALCVSLSVEGGLFASHHLPGAATGSAIVGAIAQAVATAAFLAGAGAFEAPLRGTAGRDRRLAVAASIYAAAMFVTVISTILALVAAQDEVASSAQIALVLAGSLIQLPVAILLAFAFLRSARSQQLGEQGWVRSRDRFLAVGVSALVLANLLTGIGSLVGAGQSGYLYGLDQAAKWIGATGDVTWVAAFACAAGAFLISGWRNG